MAYYDESHYYPPRDRYARPSSVYSQDYYSGDGPYNSSRHETGVVRRRDGSNESLPGDYGYEYGYGLPPQSRRSRVPTVQEGVHRSHSMGGRGSYYDDPDYHHSRHSRRSKRYDYDDPRMHSVSKKAKLAWLGYSQLILPQQVIVTGARSVLRLAADRLLPADAANPSRSRLWKP